MNVETLREMIRRQPFEPLRIKTSNGEVFEIRHPEMAMITKSVLAIGLLDADGTPTDRVEYISHLHITSIETLAGAESR